VVAGGVVVSVSASLAVLMMVGSVEEVVGVVCGAVVVAGCVVTGLVTRREGRLRRRVCPALTSITQRAVTNSATNSNVARLVKLIRITLNLPFFKSLIN
jgi:hypothetical protein